MTIDLMTVQLSAVLVTMVCSVMFILDAVLRKTDGAGRIWIVAYLSAMLSAIALGVIIATPSAWWALVVANAAIVGSPAFIWSGARVYNGRSPLWPVALAAPVVAGLIALVMGPDGDVEAGIVANSLVIAVVALAGAVEARRAPMGALWAANALAFVLAASSVFHLGRAVALVVGGSDGQVYAGWFSMGPSSLFLTASIVVTTAVLLILQGERMPAARLRTAISLSYDENAVLDAPSFRAVVSDWLDRARFHDEQLVAMRVELDELEALLGAFGRTGATQVLGEFVATVRRYGPPMSDIGAAEPGSVVVVAPFTRLEDAREGAEAVLRAVREHRFEPALGAWLTASVGIAGTDVIGYEFDRLMIAAQDAARAARAAGGDEVRIAGVPAERRP